MRTCIDYYNKKHELISEKLIGNVTEVGTEKQMTIFPNIKEQMVIFRFRDRLAIRSGFLEYYDEEAKKLDDVKEVVKNDTAYMANQIAEETPVRSGYLKRSETPSIKDDGMTGEVEAMADYSAYVEYGTRYMYGRFYMKKGHTAAAKRFLDNMEALVK